MIEKVYHQKYVSSILEKNGGGYDFFMAMILLRWFWILTIENAGNCNIMKVLREIFNADKWKDWLEENNDNYD